MKERREVRKGWFRVEYFLILILELSLIIINREAIVD